MAGTKLRESVPVRVGFAGFPDIRKRAGGEEVLLELERGTLGELLAVVQRRWGDPAGTRLVDAQGRAVADVQVLLNGRQWVSGAEAGFALYPGDRITLMVLVAGG